MLAKEDKSKKIKSEEGGYVILWSMMKREKRNEQDRRNKKHGSIDKI